MKLQIEYDFELEVKDDKFTGVFVDPTKEELKQLDKYSPTKELDRLEAIKRKMLIATEKEKKSLQKEADKLFDIIEEYDTEILYKNRLLLSIYGDDKDAIMEVGEKYGYQRVFDTINKDIKEKIKGN